MIRHIAVLFVILFTCFLSVNGQKKDSTLKGADPVSTEKDSAKVLLSKDFRNVIKLNPTPMMLWNNQNVTFSYERVLKNKKQSVTAGIGYLVFNPLIKDTIADIFKIGSRKKYGLNLSFEYRFYMMKRNSRPVPDGLYLALFFSTYLYHFENGIYNVNNNNGDIIDLTGGFYAFNLGGALGYQFVFWKRVTLDLIS